MLRISGLVLLALIGAGAALAQPLIFRALVAGGGAAVSGPQNGPPATLDLSGVNVIAMAGSDWSGSFIIVPGDAELLVDGVAGSLTTDTEASGSLDDGDEWNADTGGCGLVLSRIGDKITLSGTAEAGQCILELTPGDAASPTPLTLTALDQTKLTADDAWGNDDFGQSVALSDDTVLIGAPGNNSSSGSAYVFTREDDGSWTQQAKLTASDAEAGDRFGIAVALDGNTALIGARADDAPYANSGSAYVFTRSGEGIWTRLAKLTAGDAASSDQFGFAVTLDGTTALIGARSGDSFGGNGTGSAYVFDLNQCGNLDGDDGTPDTCLQQTELTASDGVANDFFGGSAGSVALDGTTALIGAYGNNKDDGGNNSGSAYVFTRIGEVWSQQRKLTASDAAAGDEFGYSVALSGNTALIGARYDDDRGTDSGSAYVFTWDGSNWTQQAKLTASDAAAEDYFGWSVALHGDTALIGAYRGGDNGSAYLFDLSACSNGTCPETAKLTAFDASTGGDEFGYSVALDGETILIGANKGDADDTTNSGSAYLIDLTALP